MKNVLKNKHTTISIIFVAVLILAVQLASILYYQSKMSTLNKELEKRDYKTALKSEEELRADYFATETATLVSPHTLRLKMDKEEVDFVLIDVRASEDYKKGHIKGAVSIPFDGSEEAINKVRQALENGKNERRGQGIVYCYSSACMLGRKTGKELSNHGIFVKELGIGYNNWEFEPEIWNNPGETYNINDYIERSDQPGELTPSPEFLGRPCSESDAYSC